MNTTEYRQPTHREELERELVHGASSQIAHAPENAAAIANGIKTGLDELAPVAPHPVALASAVLYPAIERAMGELSKLHPGFNMEVNRAFNLLHDAFWSECPAPASAAPKRPETPAVEPAVLPVIDPGPDSLERAMESKTYQDGTTAFGPAPLPDVSPALWAKPLAKEVPELTVSLSDLGLEREIQAKGLTAPRVTPADIEANIVTEAYFTALDGATASGHIVETHGGDPDVSFSGQALNLLTFCVLVLRNGFTVTGESACASPENFDAEIGRRIARENAVQKIWPLMGYELRTKLAAA